MVWVSFAFPPDWDKLRRWNSGGWPLVIRVLAVLLLLLAAVGVQGGKGAAPDKGEWFDLNVISYNIRVGHGSGADRDPERTEQTLAAIADWLVEEEADIVLLQEVDVGASRSLRIDQAAFLGERTDLHSAFAPALNHSTGGQYGVAILSRWPIVSSERQLLYRPGTVEQRILQVAEIDSPAGTLHVLNTHLGLTEHQRDIQLQQIAIRISLFPKGSPIIFGGDLNAEPDAAEIMPIRRLLGDSYLVRWPPLPMSERLTISARNPRRCIDYIFISLPAFDVRDIHVPRDVLLSDHLPVVGQLRVRTNLHVGAGGWMTR